MTQNINLLVDYFKNGIKPSDQAGRLGVELEHFITKQNGEAVPYAGSKGISELLQSMSDEYEEVTLDPQGKVMALSRETASITLEPAAQLELSAGPYEEIGLIRYEFEEFHRDLTQRLNERNQRMFLVGYQPASKTADLTLIPKQRYCFMDKHFASIGDFGRYMMRGSASSQISIDYFSVEDCLRKLRLASGLSPLFSLMSDNCPIFEGEPSPHQLMRTEIWQKCDPERCGLVPGVMDKNFNLEDYARYALQVPCIYERTEDGQLVESSKRFEELFAHKTMSKEDIEHVLSLLFNDVRLKTYIEIRSADAMPIPFVSAYAALIKGLFYNEESLSTLDEMLKNVSNADVEQAKNNLMAQGYEAEVYGRPAGELIDQLFTLAYDALERNEHSYLIPLKQIASNRTTLAQMKR